MKTLPDAFYCQGLWGSWGTEATAANSALVLTLDHNILAGTGQSSQYRGILFSQLPGLSSPLESDISISPLHLRPFPTLLEDCWKLWSKEKMRCHGKNSIFGKGELS